MERKKFDTPQVNIIEELSAKLLVMNQELKHSEQVRKEMLENISHDLRAPLTAIRSSVDYFKEMETEKEIDKAEFQQIVKLMDMRTKTLEVLIQDLYYLTSLDNSNNELKLERVPLGAFLEEYFFSAEIDSKYQERVLSLEIEPDFPYWVEIDVSRMTRVLDNLFTNALKYSRSGDKIILGVCREPLEDGNLVAFYVKDTGMGISAEKIDRVFDRTFMVSDARTPAETQGSGLGLAIVKEIVEKHGGKITCESIEGKGSCFLVSLYKAEPY